MTRARRHRVALPVLAALMLGACATGLPPVQQYGADQPFSAAEVVRGSTGNEAQCAKTPDSLWVAVPGKADCLRYYPSSDVGTASKVLVFLDGDKLAGPPGHVTANPGYEASTPKRLYDDVANWQRRDHVAAIYLARPGTMGSSGNQNDRRQQGETLEINQALDQLKSRYHIAAFGLAGQSGGGGLVAALIAERSDVLCAVSSSGVTAVKARNGMVGGGGGVTGYVSVWDPIDQLPRVHPMPGFRMFVLSDPLDSDVPFASQAAYVEAAKKAGLNIRQISLVASGSKHHGLARQGIEVAAGCLNGTDIDQIVGRYRP